MVVGRIEVTSPHACVANRAAPRMCPTYGAVMSTDPLEQQVTGDELSDEDLNGVAGGLKNQPLKES